MGKIKSDDKSAELHWIEEYFYEVQNLQLQCKYFYL